MSSERDELRREIDEALARIDRHADELRNLEQKNKLEEVDEDAKGSAN